MHRYQTGFSIIELMVVLTVAGIVLAIGVPSYNSQIKNSKLTSSVNQLVAAMHLSRSEASKRNVPVVLCASTTALNDAPLCSTASGVDWSDGWLIYADVDGDGVLNNEDPILQSQDKQKQTDSAGTDDLFILGSNEITQEITYLPNGFARLPLNTTASRFLVYCDKSEEDRFSRVLSFSNSGRPQIVSSDTVANGAPSCKGGE